MGLLQGSACSFLIDSMSGHRPFSELTKHFSPERRQRIAEMADEMRG